MRKPDHKVTRNQRGKIIKKKKKSSELRKQQKEFQEAAKHF